MTKEELLKERYKVVLNYPGSMFKVGEIIEATEFPKRWAGEKFNLINDHPANYPDIFKKLEWWQGVTIGDLPMYLKLTTGSIFKIQEWALGVTKAAIFVNDRFVDISLYGTLPATEEEYNSFINKK